MNTVRTYIPYGYGIRLVNLLLRCLQACSHSLRSDLRCCCLAVSRAAARCCITKCTLACTDLVYLHARWIPSCLSPVHVMTSLDPANQYATWLPPYALFPAPASDVHTAFNPSHSSYCDTGPHPGSRRVKCGIANTRARCAKQPAAAAAGAVARAQRAPSGGKTIITWNHPIQWSSPWLPQLIAGKPLLLGAP